jgi:hypothetical protein
MVLRILEKTKRAVDRQQVVDERNRRSNQDDVLDDRENLYTSPAADAPVSLWTDESNVTSLTPYALQDEIIPLRKMESAGNGSRRRAKF